MMETLSCYSCSGDGCNLPSICGPAIKCFKAQHRKGLEETTVSRGCVMMEEQINFICTSFSDDKSDAYAVSCCETNLCNNGTFPDIEAPWRPVSTETIVFYSILGILVSLIIVIALAYFFMKKNWYKSKLKYLEEISPTTELNGVTKTYRDDPHATAAGDSTLREIFSDVTSGSGSGLPLFVQRTLAKNVSLEEIVGKGRYGEVWRGVWQEENVAVKIFFSKDEASWARETEVYSTVLLRHENILGFYGSDMTSRNSCTQLWLVMHYHPKGSLYDYLNVHTIDYEELFSMLLSAINGVLHLHTPIFGTEGKPAIAHRDLKTKNILVKNDGTCCIADLGLAVMHSADSDEINIGSGPRVGTKRYMSPEVLNETLNPEVFDNYRKIDIYCMAIVMWEMCTRCDTGEIIAEYSLPFAGLVPGDPSFADMKRIVCDNNQRPFIPVYWKANKILNGIKIIIEECWHWEPNVRLTCLRLKKNLIKLANENLKSKQFIL